MILMDRVTKKYGKTAVLENLTWTLEEGKIVGLVGMNGAGKSTLLRVLAGITPIQSGQVTIDGNETGKWQNSRAGPPGRIARK